MVPKSTASYTVQVTLMDEFFNSLIPNQQIALWADGKTYITKSNAIGVATFDVGLPWSKVKDTTAMISFEKNDLFFAATLDIIMNKPSQFLDFALTPFNAVEGTFMDGSNGVPALAVVVQLNGVNVSKGISNTNGKYVCFSPLS